MELGLSLGDAISRRPPFMKSNSSIEDSSNQLGLGTLSIAPAKQRDRKQQQRHKQKYKINSDDHEYYDMTTAEEATNEANNNNNNNKALDLLQLPPHLSFPCHPHHPLQNGGSCSRAGLEVNSNMEELSSSSPNSAASISFQMDLCIFRSGGDDHQIQRDQNSTAGTTRNKKLRLSKEQSAFLEQTFKHHTTLNTKQKIALAKQLHLHPRQVEVWFQNRRARTKLKQTEVECEYLKRCCETLREENRRLEKEIHELRAFKTSNPLYMQLPATTLSMCPSCVATNSMTISSTSTADELPTNYNSQAIVGFSRFYPHPHTSTTTLHLQLN